MQGDAKRRLAAIMFADMAGFTGLSEADEPLAMRLLKEQRALISKEVQACAGKEIKTVGDGMIVEFGSAVEAARCAVAIQDALAARNQNAPLNERFQMRIGLHVGDVLPDGQDLLGSGVNLASRIQGVAGEGEICVSEDLARQIRGKLSVELESIGFPPLKNVQERVEVFRIGKAADQPTATANSLVVLPFANMSTDPENEYFSDGLTEDIITQVSRIQELRVISRTSAMQYKNASKSVRVIGRELGVSALLEGSVRKHGSRVRITAQLIDANTDDHIWAETYDRDLVDIFAVQTEVAGKVAAALKVAITQSERDLLGRQPTQNLEAYELYLQGRFHSGKRTLESLQKGIESFEKALKLDPAYAEAFSGIADSYTILAIFEWMRPSEAFPKAREAAEAAVKLKPDLAEAYASLGLVLFQYEWDWAAAEEASKRAVSLNPNYATGHHFYADFLKAMGRFDEALQQINEAKALDPLSLAIGSGVGHVLYLSRQYDQAIEAYRRIVALDPKYLQARLWFGRPYLQKGMYEEAIAELESAVELSGGSTMSMAVLAHAYASAGKLEPANQLLDQLMARSKESYVPSYWIGLVYVGMSDQERALEWLERAFEERSSWLAFANVEPRFDALRHNPNFLTLLKKIGF
jgi:TolB-like protein/Tfp pilus assembly protein PilF